MKKEIQDLIDKRRQELHNKSAGITVDRVRYEADPKEMGPDYRTLEGLKKHNLFSLCTPKQQKFIVEFIKNDGDRVVAIRAAGYLVSSDAIAVLMAHKLLRTKNVNRLLAIYFGDKIVTITLSKQELLGMITKRLQRPHLGDDSFVKLAHLYGIISGFITEKKLKPRPEKKEATPNASTTEEISLPDIDAMVRDIESKRGQSDGSNESNPVRED